ncbi:hypothetical protein FRX31_031903, partial [Thalictrum thalictroides]
MKEKLKRLKKELKVWNWQIFGKTEARIRKVERELQSLQLAADIRPTDRTLCENVQHKEAELD